jgi:hypothetical protein
MLVNTTKQLQLIKEVLSETNDGSVSLWNDLNIGRFPVDIMVSELAMPIIIIRLKSINYSVIIKDVQKLIDSNMQIMQTPETFFSLNETKPVRSPTEKEIFSHYWTATSYINYLSSLPGATKFTIGKSYHMNDIYGVRFGTGTINIVINGGAHGREWLSYMKKLTHSASTTSYIANEFLKNSSENIVFRSYFT